MPCIASRCALLLNPHHNAVQLPLLFPGALIMESFFGIPGLGSFTIDAINVRAGLCRGALHGVSPRSKPNRG